MAGVGVGDIVAAIRFAHEVCVKCLRSENQADTRYQQLVNDIRHLDSQLKRLGLVFEDASKQSNRRPPLTSIRRGSAANSTSAVEAATLQERHRQSSNIIGDFNKTLEECNAFMVRYASYGTLHNGVYDTARWHALGLDQQVQQFRTRIQFHCTKIVFLLEPLHLELQQHISQTVDALLIINRRIYDIVSGRGNGAQQLPTIAPSLASRYEEQAKQPDKRPFKSTELYPLDESIDALLFHYGRSDIDGMHAQVTSSKQLNEFLKTQWILERIIGHAQISRLAPLHRSIVARIDEKLQMQYELLQPQWIEEHVDIIATWEPIHFRIWFQQDIPLPAPPAHVARVGEEKLLQVDLQERAGESTKQLCIFRQSDTQFRVLEAAEDEPGTRHMINTHHWRLVPWYAVPNRPSSSRSFALCHSSVDHGDLFEFKSDEDIYTFQQALTKYRVVHNAAQVQWFLQTKKKTQLLSQTVHGSDRWAGLQIWEYEPLEDMEAAAPAAVNTRRPSSSGSRSASIASNLVAAMGRRGGSMRTIAQDDAGSEAIAETTSRDPVLVIFTMYEGRPSFLYVPLVPGLDCNHERCACVNLSSDCPIVVLENGRGKRNRFDVRVHSVADAQDWSDWNLLLFADPKPPAFHVLPRWKDGIELTLQFPNGTARKQFQRDLFGVLRRRNECHSRRAPLSALSTATINPRRLSGASTVRSQVTMDQPNSPPAYESPISPISTLNALPGPPNRHPVEMPGALEPGELGGTERFQLANTEQHRVPSARSPSSNYHENIVELADNDIGQDHARLSNGPVDLSSSSFSGSFALHTGRDWGYG